MAKINVHRQMSKTENKKTDHHAGLDDGGVARVVADVVEARARLVLECGLQVIAVRDLDGQRGVYHAALGLREGVVGHGDVEKVEGLAHRRQALVVQLRLNRQVACVHKGGVVRCGVVCVCVGCGGGVVGRGYQF